MKSNRKNRYWIGFLLLILVLFGCIRPIPTAEPQTETQVPASLEPLAATRTSLAEQIIATLTADQSLPATLQAMSTPVGELNPSATAVPGEAPTATSVPAPTTVVVAPPSGSGGGGPQFISSIPEVYTLHKGEFPWCLARRFNINPHQIMKINGFYSGQIFHPGQPVWLPQSPRPFPGNRALRTHTAFYTVRHRDTIYSIACYFGDIDPIAIAELNGIPAPYRLVVGQVLAMP